MARARWTAAPAAILLVALAVSCGDEATAPETGPHPIPAATSVAPTSVLAGTTALELTVEGADFVAASAVHWNGTERPTTFVSESRLLATILAADLATPGPAGITVVSPAPGGGVSETLPLMVRSPTPVLTAVAPSSAPVGSAALDLAITGRDFTPSSVVRWNGFDRPTTFVGATQLVATIPASDLAIAVARDVSVATPYAAAPSAALPFAVLNPPPAVVAIAPAAVNAESDPFTLTVTGSGFVMGSVVRVRGVSRPTTFVGATELRATIPSADVPTPGELVPITVFTRQPGGGTSSALTLDVRNPTPVLSGLSPAVVPAGSGALTLTVTGDRFVPGAVVRWNGADRPTTYVGDGELRADIPAGDVASRGSAQVTVLNPAPGGGASSSRTFVVAPASASILAQLTIDLPTRDIVADPVRDRLYVSVPGTGGAHANSVTAIDPATGAILFSIPVGSEPGKLAIADDGSVLYVGLDGEYSVRRVDLSTATAGIEFDVGRSYWGPMTVEDMVVLPGTPGTVAIAAWRPEVIPHHGGVGIYDDGVMRPTRTGDHTGANRLEPSPSAALLYGYNSETTEFGMRRLTVSSSGVTETFVRWNAIEGYPWPTDIVHADGRIYATNGTIVAPPGMERVGTIDDIGLVRPDPENGRVHFLDGTTLTAYHYTELVPLGSVTVPAGGEGALVRWGADGLAWRSPSQVVVVRTDLVGP